jgi:Secretion system C-terminal sorting domain
MKQILLLFIFSILSFAASAQRDGGPSQNCQNCYTGAAQLLVYPNPITEFLSINDENDQIRRLDIYNLMGRQIKSITISAKGERYSVEDLTNGVYFIRLIDKNNRITTTQRINKR